MARKPNLKFSFTYNQNIWKIHAFPASAYIVLELRDQEKLKVTFDILTIDGKVLVKGLSFKEDWWISIAQMIGEEMIFYTFDGEGNPETKALIAYDVKSEQILWEKEPFDLANYVNEKVKLGNISVNNPFHYGQGSDHFSTVEGFLKGFLNVHIVKAVDYLEYHSNILISYFIEGNGKLVNKLLVLNDNKEVLLHENLGVFSNGISDNTFFIIDNTLIFVKGFREFFMYDL